MVIPEFMWLLNRFIEEYGIVKFEATYSYIIYYILRDTFYHGNEYHVSSSTTPML